MKATKQATHGTFSRSAQARGKFGKICLVLLLLATAVFCGFAPRAWAEPVGCWTDEGNYDISWYTDNPEAEEYDLWDAADLAGLAYLVNNDIEYFNSSKSNNGKIVRLRAPVDMSAHYWEPIGTFRVDVDGYTDVSPCFFGTFDGGNHAISGIVVQNDGTDKSVYAGFFGYIERDSKNPNFDFDVYRFPRLLSINIVNAHIEGADKVMVYNDPSSPNTWEVEPIAAGIVAYADAGTIGTAVYDCTFSGFVSGYHAAGIVGNNNSGGAVSCVNMGGVSAVHYAGGIIAIMDNGADIEQCTNEGPVASSFAAGGIAGAHGTNSGWHPGNIRYCSSTGPVYGEKYSGAIAGYIGANKSGFDYKTNYYWLNRAGDSDWPSWQVGNAETTLGGSKYDLDPLSVEAIKVDTLAEMPPTTVIFDYAEVPFGRREDQKTAYNYSPYRFVYPDEGGVYTLGPITIYPTGSATADDIIIEPAAYYTLSRKNLTKEEYSKPFSLCVTSGYVGNDVTSISYVRAKDDDRISNLITRSFNPYLRLEKIVKAPAAITLSGATLKAGETTVLTAAFDPDTTPQSARGLKWSSDNENVATVDASGKVTAVGVGQARITAVSEVFEETLEAECVVTVNKNDVKIESVALDKTAIEITTGNTAQLSASVLPEGSPQGVTWSSSNTEVASVDEAGIVTAIAEGTAVVTATSSADSSKSASCTVTVTASAPLPVVVTADCVTQDPGSLEALTEQLPEGVSEVVPFVSQTETNALETLAAGGHTGTPNIDGIDRTEPGAVNALTTFSLDVTHDDGADGNLTMTINLSASINVAEGSSLYAFIPYRDAPQKFGSFVCTPATGEITSVTFTVTGYARFFSDAPVILASVKDSAPQPAPSGGGGGGGGCSAGLGALALLAVVPLLARRKK